MTHQGWGKPLNSRKCHYFRNGMSLCGAWLFLGKNLDDSDDEYPNAECKKCRRLLNKEKNK